MVPMRPDEDDEMVSIWHGRDPLPGRQDETAMDTRGLGSTLSGLPCTVSTR